MASTQVARKKTQEVWVSLCASYQVDPILEGIPESHKIHFLELFASKYRRGEISKSGNPVRARTVEVALSDVGAFFADMDQPDPRHRDGRLHPALKKWLVAMHKEDPASTSVLPCSLLIIQELFNMNLRDKDVHIRDVIVIAFFYLCRPGEVVKTSSTDKGRSCPFTVRDVALLSPTGRSLCGTAGNLKSASLNDVMGTCTQSTLTYTDQKNCIRGKKVTHLASGDPNVCPTRALERRVKHILDNGGDPSTPLYTYFTPAQRRRPARNAKAKGSHITTTMVTTLLRSAAKNVEPQTGIPPSKISARSLRPGGATALLCSDVRPENIALVGRWRSDAMLRYLRANTTPVTNAFSQRMLQNGAFTYNGTAAVPLAGPQEEEFPGIPDQALHLELRNQFDPTDDASDDEEEPDAPPDGWNL